MFVVPQAKSTTIANHRQWNIAICPSVILWRPIGCKTQASVLNHDRRTRRVQRVADLCPTVSNKQDRPALTVFHFSFFTLALPELPFHSGGTHGRDYRVDRSPEQLLCQPNR